MYQSKNINALQTPQSHLKNGKKYLATKKIKKKKKYKKNKIKRVAIAKLKFKNYEKKKRKKCNY
jgi:hypothetical protein